LERHILAQEPAGVCEAVGGIVRERQFLEVVLKDLRVRGVGLVQEVAQVLRGLPGLRQDDLDDRPAQAAHPQLPPFGPLVGQVHAHVDRRIQLAEVCQQDSPGAHALVLLPEDQRFPLCVDVQLVRAQQHIVVARQVLAPPE
jgi:hypothetical protein